MDSSRSVLLKTELQYTEGRDPEESTRNTAEMIGMENPKGRQCIKYIHKGGVSAPPPIWRDNMSENTIKLSDITIAGIPANDVNNWLLEVQDNNNESTTLRKYEITIKNVMLEKPHTEMFLVHGSVPHEDIKTIRDNLERIIGELTGEDPDESNFEEDEVMVAIQAIGIELFQMSGYQAEWWDYG